MYAADTKFSYWLQWFGDVLPMSDDRVLATDGKIAVVANKPTGLEIPSEPDEKLAEKMTRQSERIAVFLTAIPDKSITLPREQVLAMFGQCEHPKLDACDKCSGTGEVTHHCTCDLCEVDEEECKKCDGEGKAEFAPECRYAAMWNHPLNANLVAYILAHAPECDEYTLSVCRKKDDWHMHIVTAKWHAIFVMLSERVKWEHVCPELLAEKVTA